MGTSIGYNRIGCRDLLIPLSVIFAFLVGCYNVAVRSTRDPSYKESVSRMYILINHGQLGSEHSHPLVAALQTEFVQRNVEVLVRVANPLELDERIYDREISAYGPQAVLVLTTTGGTMASSGGMLQILYDASLYDSMRKKRIWRAQISNSGGPALIGARMRKMASEIAGKLEQEKLIGGSDQPRGRGI